MQWLASTSPWLLLFAAAGQAQPTSAQVLAVAPDDYVTQFQLGLSDERLGLLKEAEAHLKAACRIAPEAQQCRHELETVEQKMK